MEPAEERPKIEQEDEALDDLIPDSASAPYDMTGLIEQLMDDSHFLTLQALYAPNMITGFGRVSGRSVGVVANQPSQLAGTLDIAASEKAARFVRFCDAFNIPILTLVDVPGFLPGTDQEWGGIIRRGAKLHLRLRRGDRPQDHSDHPQGLRRRLHCDGLQEAGSRRQPGLAHRPDRGDGRPGCGEHPPSPGSGGRRKGR